MRNARLVLVTAGNLLIPLMLWGALTVLPSVTAPVSGPLTPAEKDLVDWAESRFAIVGLDLPDVEVSFHDHTDPCRGHDGIYVGSRDGARVAVCVPDRGTYAFDLERRRTLIHELAHAWEQANLGEADRIRLLEIVDADSWYAPESDWDQRGTERFAETIVWGLYDQRRRPTLIDVPCKELHADFISITGSTAPGPIEPICDPKV